MAANIYIYCSNGGDGLSRSELEAALETFFGTAAEDCGSGGGVTGFNLDYELADGENSHAWASRLKALLSHVGVGMDTSFDVFPDGWKPGAEWLHVEVFGDDCLCNDLPNSRPRHGRDSN